ncbi:MAG TPA: DNA cytosine methyltransferase [Planctomycetaceae bacterium]|nr:DNA cytosine methyltransferase [Planctomycetaceae bacterium]
MQPQTIRTLSLFTGAGGLDIGFHDAGFDIVEMVEIDRRFCETLRRNTLPDGYFGSGKVSCIDIRDYSPERVGSHGQIDLVIGGPPCQTFSAAGRRAAGVAGTTEARGTLFAEYVRILRLLNPKVFVFENVGGITGAASGRDWELIRKSFGIAGYQIHSRILDSADYGVPQLRKRLITFGCQVGCSTYGAKSWMSHKVATSLSA